LNAVYLRFTELADRKKRIYDQDLISLFATETTLPQQAVIAADGGQWTRSVTA
jgi:hypothetical protein